MIKLPRLRPATTTKHVGDGGGEGMTKLEKSLRKPSTAARMCYSDIQIQKHRILAVKKSYHVLGILSIAFENNCMQQQRE